MSSVSLTATNADAATAKARAALIVRAVTVAWLLAKLISWRLWTSDRLFPLAPVATWIAWPPLVHCCMLLLSFCLLGLTVWQPLQKKLLPGLLIIELLACAADQNRWQPWEYQYLFTIAIFIWYQQKWQQAIALVVCMLAGVYFYSGISKCNDSYLSMVWDNMFLRKFLHVSDDIRASNYLHFAGYGTAFIELLAGVGLVFRRTRKVAAYSLLLMHLLLLAMLGPFGINYNTVVWPWNACMIMLLYFAVIRNASLQLQPAMLWKGWGKCVLICWGILPALNWADYWDQYLSASLYSGKATQMVLCVTDSGELRQLRPFANKTNMYSFCKDGTIINLQTWAMKELNIPPYPELRVYRSIEESWKQQHPQTNTIFMKYRYTGNHTAEQIP